MGKVIDVSGSGGELVVVGNALVLPNGRSSTASRGAIRYNPAISAIEFFDGSAWTALVGQSALVGALERIAGLSDAAVQGIADMALPAFTGHVPSPPLDDDSDLVANTHWVRAVTSKPLSLHGVVTGSGTNEIVAEFSPVDGKTVLANLSATPAPPVAQPLSSVLDAAFGSDVGSVLYRSADGWKSLPPGAPGTVLGAGPDLGWTEAVAAFNDRTGPIRLLSDDVSGAMGFVPVSPDAIDALSARIKEQMDEVALSGDRVCAALGYTPLDEAGSGLSVAFGGSALFAPYANGQILFSSVMSFPVTLTQENSRAICRSVSKSMVSLPVYRNDDRIGSIVFEAGSRTGSVTLRPGETFVVGDVLEVDGPNPADSDFGSITFALAGRRC